jgi:hypothetical protein
MTIKQLGGVFGRNPTFNDVTIEGELTFDGDIDINSDLKINGELEVSRTGDGSIVTLKKGTTEVGSIKTIYNRIYIGHDDAFLMFANDIDAIYPALSTGVANNGNISLGTNTARYNDLFLAGDVVLASGSGIDFSATAGTGTSELFDDYEEGVWNPIIGGSGGQSGQSYTAQNGSYVKVGSMVMCTFDVVLSNKGTITGEVQISGLPFTSANGADFRYAASSFGLWQNLATSYVYLAGLVIDNSTRMPIRGATAAATALSSIATADINNNARFSGTVVYRAA